MFSAAASYAKGAFPADIEMIPSCTLIVYSTPHIEYNTGITRKITEGVHHEKNTRIDIGNNNHIVADRVRGRRLEQRVRHIGQL